jgi:hypothetical protein
MWPIFPFFCVCCARVSLRVLSFPILRNTNVMIQVVMWDDFRISYVFSFWCRECVQSVYYISGS